jgi:hypothetical protein
VHWPQEEVLDDILDTIKCMDKRLSTLKQLEYTTRSENTTNGIKIAAATATSLWGEVGLFEYKLTISNVRSSLLTTAHVSRVRSHNALSP